MEDKTDNERLSRIFDALSHTVRVKFVKSLAEKPLCVCELTEISGLDMSTVSRHLSLMTANGILGKRREGTKIIYSLAMPCLISVFGCLTDTCEGSDLYCSSQNKDKKVFEKVC